MLKIIKNNISNIRHKLVCVKNEAETQAKIQECESNWASIISECESQKQQYQDVINEVNDKINEAQQLSENIQSNQTACTDAKITHPATDLSGCVECLDNLVTSYNDMITECQTEMDKWDEKIEQAQEQQSNCESDTPPVMDCHEEPDDKE